MSESTTSKLLILADLLNLTFACAPDVERACAPDVEGNVNVKFDPLGSIRNPGLATLEAVQEISRATHLG